ncbi:cell surface protein [Enterococcus mundtii]|nr:cell surface protein [Enterococcus mundtii]
MKRAKFYLTMFVMVMTMVIGGNVVQANEFQFSMTPVLPENQAEEVSYFDLLMTPGQKQTIHVLLDNSTDKVVTVEANVASATTNINGVVEYSPSENEIDKTLKYDLADHVKMPKEVALQPNSQTDVAIEVTMPSETFDGVIAGGLTFKQKSSETDTSSTDKKGVSLKNEFSYVEALLLQQTKTKVAPSLTLNHVAPSQVNARNVINANLQNSEMGYLNQMKVDATVTNVDDPSMTFTSVKEMMQMAPNTNFDYPIAISNQGMLDSGNPSQPMKAGTYHLVMDVYGQKDPSGEYVQTEKDAEGKDTDVHYAYKWHFEKDFTISAEKAKELNAKDVTIEKSNTWLYFLIGGILLALLAFILFFILWKRRKKNEEDEEDKISLP